MQGEAQGELGIMRGAALGKPPPALPDEVGEN